MGAFSDFFRKGLTNPNSKLFINHAQFKPSLREIINQVHDAGGIVFLAHPYQYKFNDTEKFIDEIYDEYDLDGVECFYTTFSNRQSEYLLNFAKGKKLLISGVLIITVIIKGNMSSGLEEVILIYIKIL